MRAHAAALRPGRGTAATRAMGRLPPGAPALAAGSPLLDTPLWPPARPVPSALEARVARVREAVRGWLEAEL